jgi:hypothetical protein
MMRCRILTFASLMICLLLVSGDLSAQADVSRAFQSIRSSDSYKKAVAEIYMSYESSLSTHCPKIDVNMNTSEAKVLRPLQIGANGNVVNGLWKESTAGVACGETRLYNASVSIEEGKTKVLALFPGHSYASPLLQHDTVRYAAIGAGAGAECAADVLDTSLPEGEPSGAGVPWIEKWTVRACGKRSEVTIHFVPDATGTTINVSPKETVTLP